MSEPTVLPLVVTIGEPAGIGPDVILMASARRDGDDLPPFFVIGDPDFLNQRAGMLDLPVRASAWQPGGALPERPGQLAVLAAAGPMIGQPGRPEKADAPAVIEAIRTAVELVVGGKAAGLVTGPINKQALYAAGFAHPGHTEFLAELSRHHTGRDDRPVMMIAGPQLRTVPVTIHIPLKDVPSALSTADIIETGRIVARDLETRFGIARPRLAISGLNPHAGEGGALGGEDEAIVAPAVRTLQAEGIEAFGPLPADTMFHERARATYDAAICMYHDQALIPAKTLAFDDGVNVTLGLPFIRTSPDHGTAFDIAGTGKANPASFIAALRLAWQMAGAEGQPAS